MGSMRLYPEVTFKCVARTRQKTGIFFHKYVLLLMFKCPKSLNDLSALRENLILLWFLRKGKRHRLPYTGRFIMFSVITNIYNKKTKGPTLVELFTATGKVKRFFFLTTRDVCTTGNTAHIDTIFMFFSG